MPSRRDRSPILISQRDQNRRSPANQGPGEAELPLNNNHMGRDHQSGSSNQATVQAGFIEEEPLRRKSTVIRVIHNNLEDDLPTPELKNEESKD